MTCSDDASRSAPRLSDMRAYSVIVLGSILPHRSPTVSSDPRSAQNPHRMSFDSRMLSRYRRESQQDMRDPNIPESSILA